MNRVEWSRRFSNVVLKAMERHGYTNKTLSEATGITASAISQYLSGRRIPEIRSIINMAYALNLTVDDLLDHGGPID
jgi:transcriptional regulator with XRE-family HTH domain